MVSKKTVFAVIFIALSVFLHNEVQAKGPQGSQKSNLLSVLRPGGNKPGVKSQGPIKGSLSSINGGLGKSVSGVAQVVSGPAKLAKLLNPAEQAKIGLKAVKRVLNSLGVGKTLKKGSH